MFIYVQWEKETDRQAGRQAGRQIAGMWRSKVDLWEPVFFFHSVDPGDGTQVWHCYLLGHLCSPLWIFCLTVIKDMFYDAVWLSVEAQDFVSFPSVSRFQRGIYQVCRPEKTRPLFQSLKLSDLDGSKWKQDCLETWVTLRDKGPPSWYTLPSVVKASALPALGRVSQRGL